MHCFLPTWLISWPGIEHACNVSGGEGKNIPLDLMDEHFNRIVEDDINTFRSNVGEKSISRSLRAIGTMKEMLDKSDTPMKIKKPSGSKGFWCHAKDPSQGRGVQKGVGERSQEFSEYQLIHLPRLNPTLNHFLFGSSTAFKFNLQSKT